MSLLGRRKGPTPARSLTASGRRIPLSGTGPLLPMARAAWQDDAWAYRKGIGEIRFAVNFLRESAAKARIFPALADVDADQPTPLDEVTGVPPSVVAAATDALARLSSGTATWGRLLGPLAENFEVPGEAMLVGRPDPDDETGEVWEIRSTSEIRPTDRGYSLIEHDGDRVGTPLPDASCYVARLWQPDAQWRAQADSPMRSLLDPCEELLAVSRLVRSHAKSRIALNGVLAISTDLDFAAGTPGTRTTAERIEAELDPNSDPWFDDFVNAAMAGIGDESSPAAVLPMVIRGSTQALKDGLTFLDLARSLDPKLVERIDGALRRIGQGLDVPPEIITGLSDANHWSAWQIDDSTVRHHTEPLVARMCDALTAGFLRAQLTAYGVDPEWVRRIVVWYDLSALSTRPNRAEDAKVGHEAGVLSDRALVEALGFDPDADMPDAREQLTRVVLKRGSVDSSITEELMRRFLEPGMDNVRHLAPGQVTVHAGQDAQDAERDNPPPSIAATVTPGGDIVDAEEEPPSIAPPPAGDVPDAPGETPGPTTGIPAVAAAGAPAAPVLRAYPRESRRLAGLDRDVRESFAVAADTAVERALERAGNRIRSQANRDPDARTAAAGVPAALVASTLGADLVAGLGLDADTLLEGSFDDLARRWGSMTGNARTEAVQLAARIRGVDTATDAGRADVAALTAALDESTAAAWAWLLASLTALTLTALYAPTLTGDVVDDIGEDPTRAGSITTLVRGAMALAGGLSSTSDGLTAEGLPVTPGVGLQGLAGGDIIRGYLAAGGVEPAGYEWVYGISRTPFLPHRNLDGTVFAGYGHPVLANTTGWPGPTLAPGDHRGCHCDAQIVYADGPPTSTRLDTIGAATYDPTYLAVLRDVAATDTASGLTGTTPQQIVAEADRVANARPSRRG